jgi:hypothetical protein
MITVKINGVEYPTTSGSYERDWSLQTQPFTVTIPFNAKTLIQQGNIVEIYRDDTLVYKGRTYKISLKKDNGVSTIVEGNDLKLKNSYLRAKDRSVTTQAGTIISDNLEYTDLTAGTITVSGDNIKMDFGSTDDAALSKRTVFEKTVTVTGYEIYVSPNGALDFKAICGSNLSSNIIFKIGDLANYSDNESYIEDSSRVVYKITVNGASQGQYMYTGTVTDPEYMNGDSEIVISEKTLVSNATCFAAATNYLADLKNTLKKTVLNITDTFTGRAYDVYDVVKFVDADLGIIEDMRVYHIKKTWDTSTVEQTEVGLCNLSKLTCNGWMLDELSGIDDLTSTSDAFNCTEQPAGAENLLPTVGVNGGIREVTDQDEYISMDDEYSEMLETIPYEGINGVEYIIRRLNLETKLADFPETPICTKNATVNSFYKDTNYADNISVLSGSGYGGGYERSLLEFTLNGYFNKYNITGAILRLYEISNSSNGASGQLLYCYRLTDNSWSETTVTYNNRPTHTSSNYATLSIDLAVNVWREINVLSMLQDQIDTGENKIGFYLDGGTSVYCAQSVYTTRTNSSGHAPQLVLTYDTPLGHVKVTYQFGSNPETPLVEFTDLANTNYETKTWTGTHAGNNNESLTLRVYAKYTGLNVSVYLRKFYAQINVLAYRRDLT